MALRIKSDAEREDALRKAKSLIESEAWGKGDQSLIAEVEGISEAVEGYDRAKAGTALLSRLGEKAPDADGDRDGRLYLDFASKSFGDEIIKGVRPDGQKSLIAGGSQVVGTPLVATDPYTIGKPLQSFLNAIPAIKRPAAYSYLRQTVRTPNATVVAPGAEKPVSGSTLASVEKRLKIVATLSEPINRYDLDDNANLRLFVQTELQYALRLAMENEVLNGDGTGEHFQGIKLTSGLSVYTAPAGQVDDLVSLKKALGTYETTGETPAQIIMNPSDWTALVTKRNSGGSFDLGGAVNEETRRAWGVPVALSGLVPANTGYILGEGSVNISTDAVTHVEWDASQGFTNNTLLARAETRAEVDVVKPSAITKITFVDA